MATLSAQGREILRAVHHHKGELVIFEKAFLVKPAPGEGWRMDTELRARFKHLIQAFQELRKEGWIFTHANGKSVNPVVKERKQP